MKHTHVIEAESAAEFKKQVSELYHELHAPTHAPAAAEEARPVLEKVKAVLEHKVAEEHKAEQEKKEEPAKRGRKPKEETVTPPTSEIATAADDDLFGDSPAAPAPIPYTQEDCQKRLQAVAAAHSIVKAKEILAKFKAAKLVDLKADQYNAFIVACDEVTP